MEVLNRFVEELKTREDVLGVILFGSWARGNNRPGSDFDLVVILSEGYRRTVEYRGEQAFEIVYTTKDSALEFWKNHLDDANDLWNVAKILHDKDGSIQALECEAKKLLEAGKPEIDEHQLAQLRFDTEDVLRYIEDTLDEDPATAEMLLSNKVFSLTALYFDVRQLWTPPPKQRLGKIKELNPEFYSLLKEFYREGILVSEKIQSARKVFAVVFGE